MLLSLGKSAEPLIYFHFHPKSCREVLIASDRSLSLFFFPDPLCRVNSPFLSVAFDLFLNKGFFIQFDGEGVLGGLFFRFMAFGEDHLATISHPTIRGLHSPSKYFDSGAWSSMDSRRI